MDRSDTYLPNSVKRHPDWENNGIIAQRTTFEDNDLTNCQSWLKVSQGTTGWLFAFQVADWPDVEGLTLKEADVAPAETPEDATPVEPVEPPAPAIPVPTAEDYAAAGLGESAPTA